MTLKLYLWTLVLVALAALAGWSVVIIYIDPDTSGVFGQLLFFTALFTALAALFVFFFTKIRVDPEDEKKATKLAMSFRQGILLALLVIAILILQSLKLLVWWDALLVLTAVLLVELYFLSR